MVPPELRSLYGFEAGQYLTIRGSIDGRSVRRSYSICSAENSYLAEGRIDIGVKRVAGGVFSNWLLNLGPGDVVEVMTPEGKFASLGALKATDLCNSLQGKSAHMVAFVAGSGITPVLSMMHSWLARYPELRFTLIYGNQRSETVMFLEEIAALKNQYLERLSLHHVLSRQVQDIGLYSGRLNREKVAAFCAQVLPPEGITAAFLCGPNSMIDEVEQGLLKAGVNASIIHSERYGVPNEKPTLSAPLDESAPAAQMFIVLDGKRSEMRLPYGGSKVLDVALEHGLDLPFACKGGVCCTCRAKVLEGEVVMQKNYSLEAHEIDAGYVLTCQAIAKSDRLVISYDER
jgi:ring-1,2-phenylacetyl-CoA epoxidase subunit PaaE